MFSAARFRNFICALAVAAAFVPGSGFAANVDNGSRIAHRWCQACHVVSPTQSRTSTDAAPPFAEIAGRSNFDAKQDRAIPARSASENAGHVANPLRGRRSRRLYRVAGETEIALPKGKPERNPRCRSGGPFKPSTNQFRTGHRDQLKGYCRCGRQKRSRYERNGQDCKGRKRYRQAGRISAGASRADRVGSRQA